MKIQFDNVFAFRYENYENGPKEIAAQENVKQKTKNEKKEEKKTTKIHSSRFELTRTNTETLLLTNFICFK